ncbi:hypothetical protein Dimus_020614 [Dionaea muscipula]
MGKEHNGRVRLHRRGVTPSSLGKASTELLKSINADVTAQVTAELTSNMMQTVITQVAQHLCSSVSFHLKQINPLIDIDPTVLMRLITTAPSLGEASSALNHQSSIGLNGDSSIGANKTHSEATVGFVGSYWFYSGSWQDEETFFEDYAASHKKLSELGFSPTAPKSVVKDTTILAQSLCWS